MADFRHSSLTLTVIVNGIARRVLISPKTKSQKIRVFIKGVWELLRSGARCLIHSPTTNLMLVVLGEFRSFSLFEV